MCHPLKIESLQIYSTKTRSTRRGGVYCSMDSTLKGGCFVKMRPKENNTTLRGKNPTGISLYKPRDGNILIKVPE